MFHHLRSFSIRNRDAQELHHVIPFHVHAPACMVAYGLHNRDQALDEIGSQNHSYSGNLILSLKDIENLTCDLKGGKGWAELTEVNREYSLHSLLGSHCDTFSIKKLHQNQFKGSPKISYSTNLLYNSKMCADVGKQILPKDTDL